MNKYSWLFLSFVIVVVTTLIANEIESITIQNAIESGLSSNIELTADGVTGFIGTYLRLLAFDVEGVPALVSIWFIPWNLVIGFIIGEYIIKIVEAIIPF
jgi:hypothetical protein